MLSDSKLRHMNNVAEAMKLLARKQGNYNSNEIEELWTLGFLHDIGYQASNKVEFHAEFGGLILSRCNYKYWREILHHGNYNTTYSSKELDMLDFCDLHTTSNGTYVTYKKRLEILKLKHGEDSKKYKNSIALKERLEGKGYTDELFFSLFEE